MEDCDDAAEKKKLEALAREKKRREIEAQRAWNAPAAIARRKREELMQSRRGK